MAKELRQTVDEPETAPGVRGGELTVTEIEFDVAVPHALLTAHA